MNPVRTDIMMKTRGQRLAQHKWWNAHFSSGLSTVLCMLLLAATATGCRRAVPYRGPQIEKPMVQVLARYRPGTSMEVFLEETGLSGAEPRMRAGPSGGKMSIIYFLDQGNMHVEAQQGEGGPVLLSVPYLEPAAGTVSERLAKWDEAHREPSGQDGQK